MSQAPVPEKFDPNKVAQFLNQKWQGFMQSQCYVCKNNQWVIGDQLMELRPFYGGSMVLGGKLIPLVVVTCRICGNTMFFNAILAGVVSPPAPPPASPQTTSPAPPIPASEPGQTGGA